MSVAPGDGAPPRARVQRLPLPAKLVRRWVGDAALPLYLQMSGYAYRRVSPAYKVWLFHWSRPFFLPLIFPATYLYLASYDWAQASNRPWIAPAFGALLFVVFFIPGCGIATPSLFPRWLANTARRGFLRDLSMSQLTAGEIVRAHALARIVPMAVFSFCLAELFLAMALVEGLRRKPNAEFYLAVHALCLVFLSGGVMQECRSYGSAARHGTNAGWWIVDGLLKVIPLASVIALVSCLVAGVFLRAPSIGFGMKGGGLDWWLVVVSAATAAPLALFVSLVLGQLMFGKGLADLEANWSRVVAQATSAAEGSD